MYEEKYAGSDWWLGDKKGVDCWKVAGRLLGGIFTRKCRYEDDGWHS